MNELTKIAEESGLPEIKTKVLLEIFQEFFGMAAEWEEKAKTIKVTDESQTEMMELAQVGRKEMRDARINLEKTRVAQKKFALLEGRAVDGMANVLKFPIVKLEDYLGEQADFVVNKRKTEIKAREEKAMKLLAEQEAAEEKAFQEELEEKRLKDIKLREFAEKEAEKAKKERDEAVAKQKKIDDARIAERERHQRETEEKQRLSFEREENLRKENERKLAAEREERDAEKKKAEEKAKARQEIGNQRQRALFDISMTADFDRCADMSDVGWKSFYREKMDEYNSEQHRILLEKERAEKDKKDRAEGRIQCPSCGHVFKPELKLL